MATADIKAIAHQLIDQLPETTSWDELIYQLELRASIEQGIRESDQGLTYTTDQLSAQLGLGS